jgi:hypothetical protein
MLSDLMISEDIIIFPEEKGKEKKEKERNKEKKTKKTALSETTRFAISKAMDDVSLMRFMMKIIFIYYTSRMNRFSTTTTPTWLLFVLR